MLRNTLYYGIKPLLPLSLRLSMRRWIVRRQRHSVNGSWPILPGSETPPDGWPGWPGGKQFAVVLTHDIESQTGLDRCLRLMRMEQQHGFRASYNFIPRGPYQVPVELRRELRDNGFEVGVHDLYHDGKLYRTEHEFKRHAREINKYLRDWDAVGFRSGFMFHNLDWIHDLELRYDASTFDTDPFEPQPHGKATIFPFWVPGPGGNGHAEGEPGLNGEGREPQKPTGYVELPYTLPQDSTLFVLLQERHPDIWFQKLDWIASRGGMVLLDTHPDYMGFGHAPLDIWEYPVSHYERFLEYINARYAGAFYHALPHEVATFFRTTCVPSQGNTVSHPIRTRSTVRPQRTNGCAKPKIWIDLDNTPHVPFFEPILEELKSRGYPVLVTARDAFQVCDLADEKGLEYIRVGRHYGKSPFRKASGLAYRACQLAPLIARERPALGVSHGARSQIMLSNLVRIPTLLLEDYEFAKFPLMMRPTWVMAPSVIPDTALSCGNGHILKYGGIKEDVYAWKLVPDPSILGEMGISEEEIVVTVRPPATEAHYHNPESEHLFEAFMDRACSLPRVRMVLLPRNRRQGELILSRSPAWFHDRKTVIPDHALDGMNLIWHSDLVVSGGGTMNREAAALGVPVYSIFRGAIGAVDRFLREQHRLVLIESTSDVEHRIEIAKRPRKAVTEVTSRRTLNEIVTAIEEIASQQAGRGVSS